MNRICDRCRIIEVDDVYAKSNNARDGEAALPEMSQSGAPAATRYAYSADAAASLDPAMELAMNPYAAKRKPNQTLGFGANRC